MMTNDPGVTFLVMTATIAFALLALKLFGLSQQLRRERQAEQNSGEEWLDGEINNLDVSQLEQLIRYIRQRGSASGGTRPVLLLGMILSAVSTSAQSTGGQSMMSSPGMMIMLALALLVLTTFLWFVVIKLIWVIRLIRSRRIKKDAAALQQYIEAGHPELADTYEKLLKRREALSFRLKDRILSGTREAVDEKGLLLHVSPVHDARFIGVKRKAAPRHNLDPAVTRLILWYIGTAAFWLVLGTTIGEYLGIKFVSPDVDHISWLSFGRLRPVHTNMVFWGWSSLAMIGLGYYVVSTVSNTAIYSLKWAWRGLILLNSAVVLGSISLMAGFNNGGGEYREYTWPIMAVFASGIATTLINYLCTIARRKTPEIYISNWYIVAALMFLTTIVVVGYLPWWQNRLGVTVIQGYYMHQAVGMWFMLFNLGLTYYFLPQQLNTPIYSYSLGILAFWAQILFYTLIGTHHFLFSPIPWWLQTVAIVGSMGMLIPVFAGTTNFLLTFRGSFHKIARSYTLPFYLVGILFYFTGSTQGIAEAFRETNQVWHLTDFTVAHSHMTMYGIIAFFLWGNIYTLVPRLTGKEPAQALVGAHFWMALVGLLFYAVPLMIGGTLKGMAWVAGKPFIDTVTLMAPYWLWRAIGGSLMWGAHLIFVYNFYKMCFGEALADVRQEAISQLETISMKPIES